MLDSVIRLHCFANGFILIDCGKGLTADQVEGIKSLVLEEDPKALAISGLEIKVIEHSMPWGRVEMSGS